MITNYLPYIFGTISFIGGFYLFLLSFKLYRPKHKTEEKRARFDDWLLKFGTLSKVASVIVILNGAYDLIIHDTDRYRIVNNKNEWTPVIEDSMIVSCMRSAKDLRAKYPDIARSYCECAAEKIMQKMSYDDYLTIYKNPNKEEQLKILMPTIQSCIDEIKNETDSIKNSNKSRDSISNEK